MKSRSFVRIGGWLFLCLLTDVTNGQENSLQSALNAVDRRQKFLTGPNYESPSAVAFLSQENSNVEADKDDQDYYEGNYNTINDQLDQEKEKRLNEIAQRYLSNINDNDDDLVDDEYRSWYNYGNNPYQPKARTYSNIPLSRKRSFRTPRFGLDSAGLRKRQHYRNSETPPELEYIRRNMRSDYNSENYPEPSTQHLRHFQITKRSSNYQSGSKSKVPKKYKTDPKVEKDLSKVFGSKHKAKTITKRSEPQPNNKTTETPKLTTQKTTATTTPKPIHLSKKSIDWSDYFGLDRRKKAEHIDKTWLMERYNNAISQPKQEYSLQSFKNHDLPKHETKTKKFKLHTDSDNFKIEQMDAKLKQMENSIVDDALRYSGHEEIVGDTEEVQEMKDRIISHLAAAYSLEKMRRALEEFKQSVAKERERLKDIPEDEDEDFIFNEDKRSSVPRKEAVDSNKNQEDDEDNEIKCAHGGVDCQDEIYRPPLEVEPPLFNADGCPRVQRACSEVSTILGEYNRAFEAACNVHQMCLLCSNESWFAPTRECNMLFLRKAYSMCGGNMECRTQAQKSVRYLIDVNRWLRNEPLGDCDMSCADDVNDKR